MSTKTFITTLFLLFIPAVAMSETETREQLLARMSFDVMTYDYTGRYQKEARDAVVNLKSMAKNGDAGAQAKLGEIYLRGGKLEKKDISKAYDWLSKSAKGGSGEGEFYLAEMYCEQPFKKIDEAIELYEKSANNGYKNAEYKLGMIYVSGRILPEDDIKAAKWYRLAADHGVAEAETFYSLMLMAGRGVKQDIPQAFMWAYIAKANGSKEISSTVKELETKFPELVIVAQKQAKEWWGKHPKNNY